MSLRNNLYRAARALGTIRAAEKGPVPLTKRLIRKRIYRKEFKITHRVLRRMGL